MPASLRQTVRDEKKLCITLSTCELSLMYAQHTYVLSHTHTSHTSQSPIVKTAPVLPPLIKIDQTIPGECSQCLQLPPFLALLRQVVLSSLNMLAQ